MLRIEIRSSQRLALLLLAVHGVVLGLSFTLNLPWWGKAVLCLVMGVSAARALALHAWLRRDASVVALELEEDCAVRIQRRDGTWRDAELHASSFVAPALTVLNFRIHGDRFLSSVIILPDRVDAEVFRRLRVWLRWRCSGGTEERTIV